MRNAQFWFVYLLMALLQLALTNYGSVTPYIMITILPVMVLCIPIRTGTVAAMGIAFVTGLAVDWLSEGVLGLNALALVPVALSRDGIIRLVFGKELFARKEDFSTKRSGFPQVALAVFFSLVIFLLVYIWVDSAGTRPFWFNVGRFFASLAISYLACLLSVGTLAPSHK